MSRSSSGCGGGHRGASHPHLGGFYQLLDPSLDEWAKAGKLVGRYRGTMQRKRRKPGSLDLAAAMNVVVAARQGTNLLVATDQDYRAVTPLTAHPAFVLLPYGGSLLDGE